MPDITYKRDFNHDDWIDNEDVVQASGEKGFNSKFHALEQEFDKLSTAISQINENLVPVARATTLVFVPNFVQRVASPTWEQDFGFVKKKDTSTGEAGATGADGWMALQLPNGSKLQRMTVVGSKDGDVGSFQVQLIRQPLSGTSLNLLTFQLDSQPNSFQVVLPFSSTVETVDNTVNKYLVTATIRAADASSRASLLSFHIVCGLV